MATTSNYTSEIYFYYFNFHIVSTFAEYLNDVEQHCYDKLTSDWWRDCFNEFSPLIFQEETKIDETKKTLFSKVMAEFSKDLLTDTQTKELNTQMNMAVDAYIYRFTDPCACGICGCYGDCGVMSCGCIDVCRCYKFW